MTGYQQMAIVDVKLDGVHSFRFKDLIFVSFAHLSVSFCNEQLQHRSAA